MKDYYQILGVHRFADQSEISTAYHKLAEKFRPESIEGDAFFSTRLAELDEAYNVLTNAEKRDAFNLLYDLKNKVQLIDNKSEIPIITVFESNKKSVRAYELINIRWQTIYADVVFIDHIGTVETEGTRSFRVPEYFQGEKIAITIVATNSSGNKKSTKKIEIINKSYNNKNEFTDEPGQNKNSESFANTNMKQTSGRKEDFFLEAEKKSNSQKITGDKNKNNPGKKFRTSDIYIYVMLFVLILFVVIMLVVAYNLNPF